MLVHVTLFIYVVEYAVECVLSIASSSVRLHLWWELRFSPEVKFVAHQRVHDVSVGEKSGSSEQCACHLGSDQVFGCCLEMLCERERSTVPRFVRLCTEAVEKRGTVTNAGEHSAPVHVIVSSKRTHEKTPRFLFFFLFDSSGAPSVTQQLRKNVCDYLT